MGKDKLRKFSEFRSYSHCYEFPYELKGQWASKVFGNSNPITLEIGCGKGEYSVALAQANPGRNFIGFDLKSNRMWKGATQAIELGLKNVAFVRGIALKLPELFSAGEIDEIWITFPDPFPKDRHEKHRLTSPGYLELYRQILRSEGYVHFKTDDTGLFDYTLEVLGQQGLRPEAMERDVHGNSEAPAMLREIQTHYEKLFRGRGRTIKYARFRLR